MARIKIDATKYTWTDLGELGLIPMLAWIGQARVVGETDDIENIDKVVDMQYEKYSNYRPMLFGTTFGTRITNISSAAILEDGRVLICCSVQKGGDTFHSAERIPIRYYGLTPNHKDA